MVTEGLGTGSAKVNYYDLLQISPIAEQETVQRVYRILAAKYHPDNVETGNLDRFLQLTEAYKVLSDPLGRAQYDGGLATRDDGPIPIFLSREFNESLEFEAKVRFGILCLTYNKRKTATYDASLSVLELEKMMSIPREHLTFAIWYLQKKKFLVQDDRSSYIITAEGVDFLETQVTQDEMYQRILRAAEPGVMTAYKALPARA